MAADWDTADAWTSYHLHDWEEATAEARATKDALTFVAAYHMGVSANRKPDEVRAELLRRLQVMINRFEATLHGNPGEEIVQQFLTENWQLLALNAIQVTPKVPLGNEYVTDYVVELPNCEYILVEIEQPKYTLFTKQGNPTKELTHAQGQVRDWREWVANNIAYARQSLPEISDPECWVIIGRSSSLAKKDSHRLKQMNRDLRRTRVLTFDTLLDDARQALRNLKDLA